MWLFCSSAFVNVRVISSSFISELVQSVQKATWNVKNPNRLLQQHSQSLRDLISVPSKIRRSLLEDKSILLKNRSKKTEWYVIRWSYFSDTLCCGILSKIQPYFYIRKMELKQTQGSKPAKSLYLSNLMSVNSPTKFRSIWISENKATYLHLMK